MTRKESIAYFEKILAGARQGLERHPEEGKRVYGMRKELSEIAIAALRPVSREQVEKVWRGCEWCNGEHSNNGEISAYAEVECEGCDAGDDCPNAHSSEDPCYGMVDRALPVNFCPNCGAPMTAEAVQMMMERMEKLHETI